MSSFTDQFNAMHVSIATVQPCALMFPRNMACLNLYMLALCGDNFEVWRGCGALGRRLLLSAFVFEVEVKIAKVDESLRGRCAPGLGLADVSFCNRLCLAESALAVACNFVRSFEERGLDV